MSADRSQVNDASSVPRLPSRIPSLDGLRAISIALVVIGHSALSTNAPKLLRHFEHLGNFGVRCFFVISGFLITTLLLKERAKTGRISIKPFYIRRALRIFPPSLVYIGVIALGSAVGFLMLQPGDLVHALTYTMNYHAHRERWLDHLWSLSVEEQFYLLWPGILWLSGNRRAVKVAWGVVFIVPVIRAIMWFVFHASDSAMTKHFEANADALATGCLLSMNFNLLGGQAWYRSFQSIWYFWVVALGLVLGGHAMFALNPASFYIVGQSIANLGTVLSIDWAIRNFDRGVGVLLNSRPVVYLGAISYSLYLWQNAFLNPEWKSPAARLPMNLVLTFGCAIASYYLVEQPFLRLKSFAQRKKPSAPLPTRAAG